MKDALQLGLMLECVKQWYISCNLYSDIAHTDVMVGSCACMWVKIERRKQRDSIPQYSALTE